jgi:hypothetical protein
MKKFTLILVVFSSVCMMSCVAKKGCPSSGRNIGAERLLSGDKQTAKDLKKAGKFKGGKF